MIEALLSVVAVAPAPSAGEAPEAQAAYVEHFATTPRTRFTATAATPNGPPQCGVAIIHAIAAADGFWPPPEGRLGSLPPL